MKGEKLACSAIAWSGFCKGPHTLEQKNAIFAELEGRVVDLDFKQAEQAPRLVHYTGRRKG